MHVYILTYMHTCICIHMHVHIYIYVIIFLFIYVFIYIHVDIYIYYILPAYRERHCVRSNWDEKHEHLNVSILRNLVTEAQLRLDSIAEHVRANS